MCIHVNPLTAVAPDCIACEKAQEDLESLISEREEVANKVVEQAIREGWAWDKDQDDWMLCPECKLKVSNPRTVPFSLENMEAEVESQLGHDYDLRDFAVFEVCCSDCSRSIEVELPVPDDPMDNF